MESVHAGSLSVRLARYRYSNLSVVSSAPGRICAISSGVKAVSETTASVTLRICWRAAIVVSSNMAAAAGLLSASSVRKTMKSCMDSALSGVYCAPKRIFSNCVICVSSMLVAPASIGAVRGVVIVFSSVNGSRRASCARISSSTYPDS